MMENKNLEEKPDLLQILRGLLREGHSESENETTLIDYHIERNNEAIKAVEDMSKNPWTGEELKDKITTLKENIKKMNED